MSRALRFLLVAEAAALLAAALALLWLAIDWRWSFDGDFWGIAAAVGTVGATIVALWLGLRAVHQERAAVASLVSAWVVDEYTPRDDFPAYQRTVTVHIANESDQPVFDGHVSVLIGESRTPLGPLSAPNLAVLPQRREITFDISIPLRAHENTWDPRAEVWFTDSRGRRWHRDGEGELRDVTGARAKWVAAPEDDRQLGRMDAENPMAVAFGFLSALTGDGGPNADNLAVVLAPEANWSEIDWVDLCRQFTGATPTSMVDYPAGHIARVKLNLDPALEGFAVHGERMRLDVRYLTLTYVPGRGWRVWDIGNTVPPDEIIFPEGTFAPRGESSATPPA